MEAIGIVVEWIKFNRGVKEPELLKKINELNNDKNTHGVIVQVPIDSETYVSDDLVVNVVLPEKDVEGATVVNIGKFGIG